MNIVDFAQQILELAEERDYWRRQAIHYKELSDMGMEHINESIKGHEENWGNMLMAVLDPNSGINRAQRAIQRDPLKGAVEAQQES